MRNYRILTYKDPYRLQDTEFWSEIRLLPQFCASDVMAMSLWNRYACTKEEDRFESFFWPIDKLVKAAYPEWEGNIERQIRQHIELSKLIRAMEDKDARKHNPPRDDLFSALMLNRPALLEGLRMFIELGVELDSLHPELANTEQKAFLYIYKLIYEGEENDPLYDAFSLSDCEIHDHKALFNRLIKQSIKDENNRDNQNEDEDGMRQDRINVLNEINDSVQANGLCKIVVHGIHQFKPLQLRLLNALEQDGVEVIFLFNYLPEYSHIYSTWGRLYSWFDVPFIQDQKQQKPVPHEGYPRESYELANVLSGILDAEAPVNVETRKKWLDLSKKIQIRKYENTSEMANHVAQVINEHPEAVNEKTGRLRMSLLPEKIYSASPDADDLLKVIFPQYAGDRHFLNYPIGQFFTNLYNMWDEKKKELVIEVESLRACALSGIIKPGHEQELSGIIDTIEPILNYVSSYKDVLKRLEDYQDVYQEHQADISEQKEKLNLITFYNAEQISEQDISLLIDFVKELQSSAMDLFGDEDEIDFKTHFENLSAFIQKRTDKLAEEEEKQLISDLMERFDDLKNASALSGTMEDIRKGLFYYLSQKNRKNPNWLVRNFEQIEGDVLRSWSQKDHTYHFACLSDSLVCKKVNDILPWPLTDHFIHCAYTPVALVFQVYYSALCDYQDYMQYALFYGLFFNRAHLKISYVKHIDPRKEEQLYYPLQVLDLDAEENPSEEHKDDESACAGETDLHVANLMASMYERMDFFLCPYKYYLDYVCSGGLSFDSDWLVKKLYVNFLEDLTWKVLKNSTIDPDSAEGQDTIRRTMLDQQEILRDMFPFLRKANDEPDLLRQAFNYFRYNLIDKDTKKVKNYDRYHQDTRERFDSAEYKVSKEEYQQHPFDEMESIVKDSKDGSFRLYNFYNLLKERKDNPAVALASIREYLENDSKHEEHTGDWCNYCRHKSLCKIPYIQKA